jgi:hypothetical protein
MVMSMKMIPTATRPTMPKVAPTAALFSKNPFVCEAATSVALLEGPDGVTAWTFVTVCVLVFGSELAAPAGLEGPAAPGLDGADGVVAGAVEGDDVGELGGDVGGGEVGGSDVGCDVGGLLVGGGLDDGELVSLVGWTEAAAEPETLILRN